MSAARSSDSEKQSREEKYLHPPPRLSLWHSERYLPCKDLDISLLALITSWNMNKSAESGEEPRRAFVNRYWLILRGKEGRSGCHGEPLFTDHLLTLSKELTRFPKLAGGILSGHQRVCDSLIKVKKKSLKHISHVIQEVGQVNRYLNAAARGSSDFPPVTEIFQEQYWWFLYLQKEVLDS